MSRRTTVILGLVGAVVAVSAVIIGLSALTKPRPLPSVAAAAPAAQQNSADVKSNDGGSVQVEVTLDRTASADSTVVFQVSMNTHSVELGHYDLAQLSQLTLEPGGTLAGATWKPNANGGHHVGGTLTFGDPDSLFDRAKTLTLEIRDLAGVPNRTFQWQR